MEHLLKLRFLLVLLLSSCSTYDQYEDIYKKKFNEQNNVHISKLQSKELANVKTPIKKPIVAIYPNSFKDQTGQRKSNSEFALFSTAITQQPGALLIRALKHAGNGEFFRVVERVGLDNLTKERQLIRSARETLGSEEDKKKVLSPLLFAGVLIEGAVIAYESNLSTGGMGARYLGIGSSIQYREDSVTVTLRMVSVSTGEILIEVMTEKTIFSYGKSEDVFRFIEMGTKLVEIESGNSRNESTTLALSKAIEGAVLTLINIGYDRGYWSHEKINIDKPTCNNNDCTSIRG